MENKWNIIFFFFENKLYFSQSITTVIVAAEEKICGSYINIQITFYTAKGVHLLDVLQQTLMWLAHLFPLKGI